MVWWVKYSTSKENPVEKWAKPFTEQSSGHADIVQEYSTSLHHQGNVNENHQVLSEWLKFKTKMPVRMKVTHTVVGNVS